MSKPTPGEQFLVVKFSVLHGIDVPEAQLIDAVSMGWPAILSSLKSLLETGEPLEATRRWQQNPK